MALIKCKECGKEISDKAVSCPHCGCPLGNTQSTTNAFTQGYVQEQGAIKARTEQLQRNIASADLKRKKDNKITFIVTAISSLIGFILGCYGRATSNTGLILLLIITVLVLDGALGFWMMFFIGGNIVEKRVSKLLVPFMFGIGLLLGFLSPDIFNV